VRTIVEKSLLLLIGAFMVLPLLWMAQASVKQQSSILATPPQFLGFEPTAENYRNVFVARGTQGPERRASGLVTNFANSVIVAVIATLLATVIGTPAAWAYSRFPLKAGKNQLFFILSTRFIPPVVAVIPLFLMYRTLGLLDTRTGLILLYTAFNLPFTIWMLKGFVDEIPAEYEDAAMVDGFSRVQAFRQVLLPLLRPGIFATAVFSLIFTWNEFVFAIFLTPGGGAARTAPPAIAGLFGGSETQWGLVAASAMVFAFPVLVFGYLVRKHLVAGMTFGAVRR
jgi:multiple sugar transport system permease protein